MMRAGLILSAAAMALGIHEMSAMATHERGRAPRRVTQSPVGIPAAPKFNGTREVARRARQIAAGKLKVSV